MSAIKEVVTTSIFTPMVGATIVVVEILKRTLAVKVEKLSALLEIIGVAVGWLLG